ncbi:ferritin, spleen middle subunit-like [Eptesicus fuscus]|uniref:ferritin, spleen middle subunit-like n=1 Tax=Eptesicus fuscus TaxID=29078 RepID=UPI0024045F38|nr:ferritin, spleen middle subunit-like [Eptesicus fuscus]
MEGKKPLCAECSVAVNKLASYKLHISDAYLSMACNSLEDTVQSLFAEFFEDQADVKRENGKQFIKYLRKCGNTLCLPMFKRPEIDNWGTGISALECALELEDQLTKLLLDLKTTASANKEYDLLCFLGKFLDEQVENTEHLRIQLSYRKQLENEAKKEKDPLKKPAEVLESWGLLEFKGQTNDPRLNKEGFFGDHSGNKRPEVDNWQTGIKALECALELENQLTKLLMDLRITAATNNDSHLLSFMKRFQDKQRKDITHLQHQIVYFRILEKEVQKEEEMLKKAAERKPVG